MNRREFLKLTGASGVSFLLAEAGLAADRTGRKPNIVFLILDELGYYELSCMGHSIMETPNIDKIVSEGMRFTQMLAGAPVCAPTRSTLMTGKHMGHTSVRRNPGHEALRAEDVTVAQLLKKVGYATGGFGKWGVGGRGTTGVPEKHGFDVFLGY
ncbi:MAG: sulfatase-like hydrolase/transferase, partial [Planctomycetota bacterium]